ncbi:hypothetical protein [Olleya sp. HaHaR_3_96]|uniref:hypothetical protein n=1 Tax=Olleya sp. HaHaR_3_96 TaxID=2745560 RepID=UPI001C4EE1EF|nr:hypothetical protein [Olleya sp. HaHaR_3_96]QXP58397.1 hypothetical protein H0I26_10745 [Olleya sp. HaHaR_3_96]
MNYYNALHAVKELKCQVIEDKDYENDSFVFAGFTIEKEVVVIKEENIVMLNWKIKINNRVQALSDIIVYYEN